MSARQLQILSGAAAWCREQALALLADWPGERLWVGESAPEGFIALDNSRRARILGHEFAAVVIDAHHGLSAETLGAVSGTLRRGGVLLLLTPELAAWPHLPDPDKARIAVHPYSAEDVGGLFVRRLIRVLQQASWVGWWQEGDAIPSLPFGESPTETTLDDYGCATTEQHAAVEAIAHTAHGHRHRPLVLTSDRGRGKSAALGIAAARLLTEGVESILVTGPRAAAANTLFEHAARQLPQAERDGNRLATETGELCFVAPDLLLEERPATRLLLVEEAAAIPAPLLEAMLAHYPRIVFVTTVHGYEGTGRGFALRFSKTLDRLTPGWQALRLNQPIRWDEGDRLEALIDRALLLDATSAADSAVAKVTVETCTVEVIDRVALAADETTLSELFGLLVLAHYRTSPDDLRQLLDGPELAIHVLRHEGHIVATALVTREGGFEPELANAIYLGERRPRGHLLPQSLANHAGFAAAATLRGERIMRIAVHPALWGRGLGSHLLAAIEERARSEGLDFVGTSFGATEELLRFWDRAGYRVLRIGFSRGAASGGHSALMLRPLSAEAEKLHRTMAHRFDRALPTLLAEPLRGLEPHIADWLLAHHPPPEEWPEDTALDRADLASFAHGRRDYGNCLPALSRFVISALGGATPALTTEQRLLLEAKVVRGESWSDCAERFQLPGKRALEEALREVVTRLLENDH